MKTTHHIPETSDTLLMLAGTFVADVARVFRRAHDRNPKPEELASLLSVVVESYPDAVLDWSEKSSFSRFVACCERPRNQRRRLAVGDVFLVPLTRAIAAIGRIRELDTDMGTLVSFYSFLSRRSPTPLMSARPLCSYYVSATKLRSGDWPRVGRWAARVDDEASPEFVQLTYDLSKHSGVVIRDHRPARKAAPSDLKVLPEYGIAGCEWVEQKLRQHYRQRRGSC